MKKKQMLATLLLGAALCSGLLRGEAAKLQAGEEFWRIDTENEARLPRNFRTSDDAFAVAALAVPSRQGLEQLHESGSAQFSRLEFDALREAVAGELIIVDLRQESHGLLNGIAVSWYGERDWANVGKTQREVLQDEAQRLASAQGSMLRVAPLGKDKRAAMARQIFVLDARSEEDFVRERGVGYVRFAVTDHLRPDDETVDRFLAFCRNVSPTTTLHFHCQAGHGRTTTFMAMYDMLKNAGTVSFEDIIERQHLLGGADLLTEASTADWKINASRERLQFLRHFYDYAAQQGPRPTSSWTDWNKKTTAAERDTKR